MINRKIILLVCLIGIIGYMLGIFTANYIINFGAVDFIAGMPDKKVVLKNKIELIDGHGNKGILKKGAVLTWEGAHGGQYYLSIRYILNDGSLFELVDNDNTYDFIQK